ncbi:putative membrane protein [Georgenia satyanarayanai]|uniref:Putative membrane protein n=2 Tax=Georgenia satyanarayanai TaxID=860221 RepID=A0A2Y8ZWR0_9MICO|nr:putative membrane protein [Georgenia satyanarayanai]SSA36760.1 putative membrane protein [Georgenia satyanarayanai]
MGSADIVPGVSGGTVALVLGIYERLVHTISTASSSLGSLARGDLRETGRRLAAVPWVWVLALLAGIGAAVLLLSGPLEQLLAEQPQAMAGLFLGLITGAVVVSWHLLRRPTPQLAGAAAVAGLAFFLFLGLQDTTHAAGTEAVTRPWWAFFLAGAVAICAMILPGISGSFILVLLGMYTEVLGAVNERQLGLLLVFLVGCGLGLAAFSSVLTWLLDHHHDLVLAVLIGLMLGSLRILWPWPHGLESTTLGAPSGPVLVPVLLAVAGFAVVVGVDRLGRRAPSAAGAAR